jgi:hypothetical protein
VFDTSGIIEAASQALLAVAAGLPLLPPQAEIKVATKAATKKTAGASLTDVLIAVAPK